MSGKDNHFVPQFLQSGFLSRACGEKRFTWLYRNNADAREVSTRDWGKKRKFYWKEEDSSADDYLTNVTEREAVRIVNEMRNGLKENVDRAIAARIISHFEIRSRSMRDRVKTEFKRALAELSSIYLHPETLRQVFIAEILSENKHVDKFFDRSGVPQFLRPHIRDLMVQRIRTAAPSTLSYHLADHVPSLDEAVLKALSSIKDAQLELMQRSDLNTRYSELEKFSYEILFVPDQLEACLGDSMVVYRMKAGHFRGIFQGIDETAWVALPLSHNRVLVGSLDEVVPPVAIINEGSSRIAQDGFITQTRSPQMRELSHLIGSHAFSISEVESSKIVQSVILKHLTAVNSRE